jgi:diguanylate cyclase (GGDEF)-like protein
MTSKRELLDSPLFSVLDGAFEGIAVVDLTTNRVVYLNSTLTALLGCAEAAVPGLSIADVLDLSSAGASAQVSDVYALAAPPGKTYPARLLAAGQPPRHVAVRFCRLPGEGQGYAGVLISQAELETTDATQGSSPRRDPLTGLHDRAFLKSRLAALLAGDRSADQQFVLLFVDVDGFKRVNDAYGHLVGDGVLREVASRLKSCVRDHDHVVRFGGDEFVVLAENVSGANDVEPIIDRIHAILAQPISVPGSEVTLSVSIGVAEASPHYRSPEELLDAADRAMYATKRLSG